MSPHARDAACVIAISVTARAECDAMPAASPFLEKISPKIARRMLYLSFSNVLLTDRVPNAAEKNCKMKSEEFNTEFLKIKDSAFRYALSLLRDRHAAEDAAQDLYEKLWRRRLLIGRDRFPSLAMVSMRNICLDRFRRRERDRLMTGLEYADRERQADRVDCDDVTDIVRRLTEALPQREREAMYLRNVEGMEFDRIAELTGTSEAAARMACSRARNKIRDELTKIMNHGL
ncbi:sigma-70 family RNA polymerase sigma factor [Alistipes sp. Z76]|nr:sigma-70 family RNA polymerase sigma factor [Alistipes sp. Z76]NCE68566.1 sigma-70 family RNA polymerase sigma factor [Muribaculaceae bacterium M3]